MCEVDPMSAETFAEIIEKIFEDHENSWEGRKSEASYRVYPDLPL